MKKSIVMLAVGITCLISQFVVAQNSTTQIRTKNIYAEFGFGAGQTIIANETKSHLKAALGGSFDPVLAGNLTTAFYYAPSKWKGLGLGTRLMWSGGPGAVGENGDDYFFNYYNISVSAKYYALSHTFNKGLYLRLSLGTGQLTTKRANDAANSFTHQFAIGSTVSGNIGYSFQIGKNALSLEGHFETSSRSGTINGLGGKSLKSGQIGANIIYSF
jgi:hypothetical protein